MASAHVRVICGNFNYSNTTLEEWFTGRNIPRTWEELFSLLRPLIAEISLQLKLRRPRIIYPELPCVFKAFCSTTKNNLKVVIIGQDPYHNGETFTDGSAVGLAFSVRPKNKINPTLKNIYKEISAEGYTPVNTSGDLRHWAEQGVLLLNTALTVEQHSPDSHSEYWIKFTEKVINYISQECQNIVWIFWGNPAKAFQADVVNKQNHLFLTSFHPSPLSASRGFFGCGHFRKTNEYLKAKKRQEIQW